jgi:hypothetical protein
MWVIGVEEVDEEKKGRGRGDGVFVCKAYVSICYVH